MRTAFSMVDFSDWPKDLRYNTIIQWGTYTTDDWHF